MLSTERPVYLQEHWKNKYENNTWIEYWYVYGIPQEGEDELDVSDTLFRSKESCQEYIIANNINDYPHKAKARLKDYQQTKFFG
jgi:hypothetical protein